MRRELSLLMFLSGVAFAAQAEIYQCIDASGNKSFTNNKVEAAAAGCKLMNLPPVSSIPAPTKPGAGASQKSATPGAFPKVDPNTQQQRDDARRKILEQEMASEQKLLDQARRDLAEQEAIRLGSERNYQRVLDRLEPYKKKVALHEGNIANLRKELSLLR